MLVYVKHYTTEWSNIFQCKIRNENCYSYEGGDVSSYTFFFWQADFLRCGILNFMINILIIIIIRIIYYRIINIITTVPEK